MALKAPRPRAVPKVLAANVIFPFAPGADEGQRTSRALDAVSRNLDAISGPVAKAVTHPTLRDQVGETYLVNGDNWIAHGLGRIPRFVYVVVLDYIPAPGDTFRWSWQRQTPRDLDARRINLYATVSGTTAGTGGGELGGVLGAPPTGALHVLVRVE